MKCEKQRHQGEENSSNPKRGTSVFRPHTPGCWGNRSRRGCFPRLRAQPEGQSPARAPQPSPQQGQSGRGPQLIWAGAAASNHAPHSFVHSFIHSTHRPCVQHRRAECTDKCLPRELLSQ